MSFLLWLPLDLLIVSFAEYAAHRWLMHTPTLDRFHFPHALHHVRYYRKFDYEPDPIGREHNLRIGWSDTLLACAVASPLAFLSPVGYAILFVLALCQRWAWNVIHPEMHLAEGRWFTGLWLYRRLAWHRFLHHRHPNRNYNVTLPLFDWVFGTRAKATDADRIEWLSMQLMGQAIITDNLDEGSAEPIAPRPPCCRGPECCDCPECQAKGTPPRP